MQKIGRIGFWGILILIILTQLSAQAQSKKYFIITGKIVPEEESAGSGTIEITKNGKESMNIDIPKNNRFRFELEFFNEYSLTFKYPGHFNKIIVVSTDIPQEVWQRDNDFPPFPMIVQLIKEFPGIDKSFTLKPSGKIFYGKKIDNFEKESYITDLQFTEQIATAKNQANQVAKEAASISKENAQDLAAKQKNFEQVVKDADVLYQRGDYQMALMKYQEAHNLFPDKAYPNDRIAELQDLVKALMITEKQKTELEQKYQAAIAKANGFFDKKSYKEARPGYEEALQYKPGDVFANGRIKDIDQLLAALDKQNQFNDLIAKADNLYKTKKLEQAIDLYNQAKQLVPDEKYPQQQIALITQEQQQIAKAQQLETDFNKTLQDGTNSFQQKDYLQALNSFKKALELKPNNQLAKDKIAETEQAISLLETDKKYAQAIQLADQSFSKNDFGNAKMQYQDALKIKNEAYPKTKLAEIATIEAKEEDFRNLLTKAEKAIADNQLDQALATLAEASNLKPNNPEVKKLTDEIQSLKNKEQADKEYASLIAQADQNYNAGQWTSAVSEYNKALILSKSESYPKDQLKKIESILALVKKGDKSFEAKAYPDALSAYNNILDLKANDSYASDKIAEIQKIQADLKQLEEESKAELLAYNEKIKEADQLFGTQNYTEAKNKYTEALAIKQSETYPQKKINEIAGILDKIEKEKQRIETEYKAAIALADKDFQAKNYANSLGSYNKALVLKPADNYATQKIADIQKIQLEQKQLDEKIKAELLAYNEKIKEADQLFGAKNYLESKNKYSEALAIKANEAYPQKKIAEIETILDTISKEKARIEADYRAAIDLADNLYTQQDFSTAKSAYQKASSIKSDESYPKDQIKRIDETIAENLRKADEAKKLQEAQLEMDFAQAMSGADEAFSNNNFELAKTGYQSALKLKPNHADAKKKYAQTEAKLAQIAKNTQAYNKAIAEANTNLTNQKYIPAKEKYQEALQYLPDSELPKTQIAKIDAILAQQEADAKIRREFDQAVATGETLLKDKELDKAKDAYMKAYNLIPSEVVPPQKISEINDLLAEKQRKESELKATMEAYQKVIQRADIHFANKEYTSAQLAYNEATLVKPDEKYPQDQLNLIAKLVKEQTEQNYKAAIAKGDKALNANLFDDATSGYQEALKYKKDDQYALGKLKETEQKKAALEAENARVKKLENQYKSLIAEADNSFSSKDYPVSKDKYQQALKLKQNEAYPKNQIAKIDGLVAEIQKADEINKQYTQLIQAAQEAFNANKLKEARGLYQKGSDLKPGEPIPPARIAEIDKILAQQEESAKLASMEEAQRLAKEKADKEKYNQTIKDADKAFGAKLYSEARSGYINALSVYPEEKYPKNQIAKIDDLIAQQEQAKMLSMQKAQQDSLLKAKDKLFNNAIAEAKTHDQNQRFEQAIMKYNDAISIKPDQRPSVQKLIAEIEKKMQLAAQREADYKKSIQAADGYFNDSKLSEAVAEYKNALKIKPTEVYPQSQINEIQNQLNAREQKYKDALANADKAFNAAKWINAKTSYTEALSVKPAETYPAKRLKEVNQKIEESNLAAQSKAAQEKAYQEAIAQAESLALEDQLNAAKLKFKEAQSIKPEENLPAQRIKEIDALLEQRNRERMANQQRDIDEKYGQAITLADNSYQQKSYSVAKLQYQQASLIKPEEAYPKTQMALMDKLLNEAKAAEKYVSQVTVPETPKPENKPQPKPQPVEKTVETAAPVYENTNNYSDVLDKADKLFSIKDYTVARFYYYKASDIKPTETYPKQQIEAIRKLIDSQISSADLTAYNNAITQADNAFASKNYPIARFYYYKALSLKSWEKYPKDRINEIAALTHSLLSEKEEQTYQEFISKADEAFANKDMAISRFYYNKALSIKKEEEYPRIKLKDIQKQLSENESAQTDEQFNRFVGLADEAMQAKNYTLARFNYNKALALRPNEKYPKDQLKKLKELIEAPKAQAN